ncbi:hypothetical protein Ccrd_008300, partial [Cynara cardunculus var. scolymus]
MVDRHTSVSRKIMFAELPPSIKTLLVEQFLMFITFALKGDGDRTLFFASIFALMDFSLISKKSGNTGKEYSRKIHRIKGTPLLRRNNQGILRDTSTKPSRMIAYPLRYVTAKTVTVAETRESRELSGEKQSFVDSFASSSLLSSDQLLKFQSNSNKTLKLVDTFKIYQNPRRILRRRWKLKKNFDGRAPGRRFFNKEEEAIDVDVVAEGGTDPSPIEIP